MTTLPWWALSGRLWFDSAGYIRYSVSFGDPVTARRVRKAIRIGAVRAGQITATGKRVPALLRWAGAPWSVQGAAAEYARLSPGRDPKDVLRTAQIEMSRRAAAAVEGWFSNNR